MQVMSVIVSKYVKQLVPGSNWSNANSTVSPDFLIDYQLHCRTLGPN